MKKLFNSKIFYFVLGAVLFSGMTVFAYSLNLSDISYTPTNENFEVNNAQEAIDKLYELSQDTGVEVVNLGTAATIDVSSYDGYENFTEDNFLVTIVSFSASTSTVNGYQSGGGTATVTKSYNAETGVLTISPTSKNYGMGSGMVYSSIKINTYLIY